MFFEKGKASYVGKQSLTVHNKKNSKCQNVSIMSWKFSHMIELMENRIEDPSFSIIDNIKFNKQTSHTKRTKVDHKDYLGWIESLEDLPPKEVEQLVFFIEGEFDHYISTRADNAIAKLLEAANTTSKLITHDESLATKKVINTINNLLSELRGTIK